MKEGEMLQSNSRHMVSRQRAEAMGDLFQFLWVIMMAWRTVYYNTSAMPYVWVYLAIGLIGVAIYNQLRVYYPLFARRFFKKKAPDRLITTGWFRLTRHPIYTFALMADFIFISFQPIDWKLVAHTIVFYAVTIIACYWHEQMVLTQFGEAAKDYYAKTPRVILLYPLRWLKA